MYITTSNLVVLHASKGVYSNRGEPQKWGALGPRPLAVEAWLNPLGTALNCISGDVIRPSE